MRGSGTGCQPGCLDFRAQRDIGIDIAAHQGDPVGCQLFASDRDQIRRVRVHQRLCAVDQLAGALGDQDGQDIAVVDFGQQFFQWGFYQHRVVSSFICR